MSGIEVVGVVLGTIPLLISALEHYRHGASAIRMWRRYDRELKSLTTDLENERIRLQDVSEKLLTGIVPDSKVDDMVNDPFGPAWHEDAVRKMIEARLWNLRPYQILLEKVEEIKLAIEDIAKLIDLPLNEEHPSSNGPPLGTALKRIMFAVGKSTYTGSMTIIKNNITDIESLIDRSIEMAPMRESRARGRTMQLVHELAGSLHQALLSSFPGNCSHEVYMQVMPQTLGRVARRSDEEILQNIDVHMSMNFGVADQAGGFHQGSMWEEIVIRYHQLKKPRRSVDTNKPVDNDVRQATPDSDTKVTIAAPNPIVNLCEEIRKRQVQGGTGSYGEITDKTLEKPRKYRVYPGKCLPGRDAWSAVALWEVLEDASKYSGLHGQYVAKRKLATSVSVGFLQLHQTHWLPDMITSHDVLFLKKDSLLRYGDTFVMATLPSLDGRLGKQAAPLFGCRNPALVSLGILLAELGCGKTMESMRKKDEKAMLGVSRLLCDRLTAYRVLRHELGGTTYANAVRCCIEEEFNREHLDLTDQDFRQEVYERVVRPMEDEQYGYV
ncbi:hypothetical protein CNYM01_06840 [Colletotrichum nymphaeae SA-01]|uniref:DUF7580 domain-containing protein n=1 Tax=Colletotrichum nymphaeae SA-01 TaxID=1460502 RepID=A0A135TD62_9PEZI|nr:hypothetical protein CNYM01_06840 [Colletotrichum nymphaeae SA-01]